MQSALNNSEYNVDDSANTRAAFPRAAHAVRTPLTRCRRGPRGGEHSGCPRATAREPPVQRTRRQLIMVWRLRAARAHAIRRCALRTPVSCCYIS